MLGTVWNLKSGYGINHDILICPIVWKDFRRETLWPSSKEHVHEANRPHGGAVVTSVLLPGGLNTYKPPGGSNNSPIRELCSLFLHMEWQGIWSTNEPVRFVVLYFILFFWHESVILKLDQVFGFGYIFRSRQQSPQH